MRPRRRELGGQLSETETGKSGNMSEVLRRNPSNKTSEIRRTFVFRTSTPVRAAVTSENKHSICDIFSEYFLLKRFAQFIYSPKIIYKALLSGLLHCWQFQQVTDVTNNSSMPECLLLVFAMLLFIYLSQNSLHDTDRCLSTLAFMSNLPPFYSSTSLYVPTYTCSNIDVSVPNAVMGKWNIDTKDQNMLFPCVAIHYTLRYAAPI